MLFGDLLPDLDTESGYRAPAVCKVVGITYRQLDHWDRTGFVSPTIRRATGSGSQRLYSFRDILVLRAVKRLIDAGVSVHQARNAMQQVAEYGIEELSAVTFMSDGASVYLCTSDDEVIDLINGGQGVFGIALGRVWREVEGSLSEIPAEQGTPQFAVVDELAERRARRNAI
ncbi:MAG: MerR family transcriptional regulator [Arcanobacterium sp.]|nr:MerR family transcriptional regulator [Arcanobacterium sp.]